MNKDVQTIIYRYLHRYRTKKVLKEYAIRCLPYNNCITFDRFRVGYRDTNESTFRGHILKLNCSIGVALLPKRYFYSNGSLKNDSNE
jgi:hypothetical protein